MNHTAFSGKHRPQIMKFPSPRLDYSQHTISDSERSARNNEIIFSLEGGITTADRLEFGPLVRRSDISEPVQRWFTYREGYTVELCRNIISKDDTFVFDPFCGFGSTLLAAKSQGIASAGLDVNPLAAFVSTVKTRSYSPTDIKRIRAAIQKLEGVSVNDPTFAVPTLKILPKLFHIDILQALSTFRYSIESIQHEATRHFLRLAWIAILEDLSNVYREGNGVKYRNRLRRGNTYSVVPYTEWEKAQFPESKFPFVRDRLIAHAKMMLSEAALYRTEPCPTVRQGDAADAHLDIPKEGASLALFSPPYCNCFNYIKAYKLELWMAGFIQTYPDIRLLTQKGVRSRLESLTGSIRDPYPLVIEELVALMITRELWSPQLPDLIRGYFADMFRTLKSVYTCLKSNGRCVIVVGNSAYAGVVIPSDLILCEIARKIGFDVESLSVARHLTTSSQQKHLLASTTKRYLRESVLYLRKGK